MERYEKFYAEWRSLTPEQRLALIQRMTASLDVITQSYREMTANLRRLGYPKRYGYPKPEEVP
jgi:hypothetical protein